ncbi:hypothetical protein [Haloplanus sp. C73]|uniref:hypothetical protein n=1 Tax=Haloplanus sp. C73 TaxID=3421641 RepID=UPI003EBD1BDE
MTELPVRAAAIDRALLGDDPRPAFALVGALDGATAAPLTAAMLAITCVAADRTHTLDERAWHPGDDVEPLVVAGAAVTVRRRDVAVEHVAELAGCAPARLRTAVERGREKSR